MLLADHLNDDVFGSETAPTITVMMSLQAKSLRNEHPPLLAERTHQPTVFGSREPLQRTGQKHTHGSVDERFEPECQLDPECLVVQHGGVIQQLNCQLNVLRKMKQNTLGSVKPENGSLPLSNRCTLVSDEVSMLLDLGRPMRSERSNIAELSEIVCSAKQTAKVAHGLKRETCHFPYLLGLIKECHPSLRHEWVAQRTESQTGNHGTKPDCTVRHRKAAAST